MIVQTQAGSATPPIGWNPPYPGQHLEASAGTQMFEDTFEVHCSMPRIVDPRHPEGSNALNDSIRAKFAEAEATAQPMPGCSGSLDGGVTKTYDDGHLMALCLSFDSYSGGAHPNTRLETVLYDSDRGRAAGLEDLFADKAGYLDKLSREVTASLAGQEDVSEGFISSCVSPTASNFVAFQPTADGLLFAMPAERSGPYGAGIFDARVGWDQLRPSLDPHGPLWRESLPFTWSGPDDPRRESFARLVGMYDSDDSLAGGRDPKTGARAADAVEDFLVVTGAAQESTVDLAGLTEHYAGLHHALARFDQADATAATFTFIEDGLRQGLFGQSTRQQVASRFIEGFLLTGSLEQARNHATAPPEGPVGGVDVQQDSVVIAGVRVPVHRSEARG